MTNAFSISYNLCTDHIRLPRARCNFLDWILNNILLSEDIWGDRLDWPSTTSHMEQDRAETVIPASANDSRRTRETGRKLSPVISVFKSVFIIAFVLFGCVGIPRRAIIKMKDCDSTVTLDFGWGFAGTSQKQHGHPLMLMIRSVMK